MKSIRYFVLLLLLFANQVFANEGQFLTIAIYESLSKSSMNDQSVEMSFNLNNQESTICYTAGGMMQTNELGRCSISYYSSSYFNEKFTVKRLDNNDYQISMNNESVTLTLNKKFIPQTSNIGKYGIAVLIN